MSVGKYTPNAAVYGDITWIPSIVRQLKAIGRLWTILTHMDNNRLNKRDVLWSESVPNSKFKNWSHKVKAKFANLDLNHFFNTNNMNAYKHVLTSINDKCMSLFREKWLGTVNTQKCGTRSRQKQTSHIFKI